MTYSFYECLNIPQNATTDDVKKAYRRLAIQHHPDKGGDVEMFKKISHAYEILSSPEKRNLYDRVGDEGFNESNIGAQANSGFNMFNLFNNLFNSFVVRKKDDIKIQVNISLEECYKGILKDIPISLEKRCTECNQICEECKGTGNHEIRIQIGPIIQNIYQPCSKCRGQKSFVKGSCEKCSNGIIRENRTEKITIPPGVPQNFRIIKDGLGVQPDNQNETPGNLVITVNISSHPHLQIRGNDLVYNLNLSFIESVVGKTIDIPHIDENIEIDLSEYGVLKNGEYRVKGKGMPVLNSQTYGDLVLKVDVIYPTKKLNEIEKRILNKCLGTIF